MIYSKKATISAANSMSFRKCITNYEMLVRKEGCVIAYPIFLSNELVIDMDCAESITAKIAKRTNNKSMDSAFIALNGFSELVVLVELRFNYKSMNNLRAKDLKAKKQFTSKIFSDNGFNNFHNQCYYIFDDNLKEQARRHFRNLHPSMPSSFKPLKIEELKDLFF